MRANTENELSFPLSLLAKFNMIIIDSTKYSVMYDEVVLT